MPTNRAETQAKLMEMWVECPCGDEIAGVHEDPCDDSRRVYPLHRECPGVDDSWEDEDYDIEAYDQGDGQTPYVNIGPVTIVKHIEHKPTVDAPLLLNPYKCLECGGRGYVYNDAEDALEGFIRGKGWSAVHAIESPYDVVEIYRYDYLSESGSELIGMVDSDDQLRDRAALELAVARAGESE